MAYNNTGMRFREKMMLSYLKSLNTIGKKDTRTIISVVEIYNIPIYSLLMGIKYYELVFKRSRCNTNTKLLTAIYFGYRINEDYHTNNKDWGYLTNTCSKLIVKYETHMLKKLNYNMKVTNQSLEHLFERILNFGRNNDCLSILSPVSPTGSVNESLCLL